jgi:head-tail adaptor
MENKVNIGELDTLVTVRRGVQSSGQEGQKKFTYSFYRDVYAKVERNVSELVANTNLEEGDYVQLTIYKIPELTTRWRIVLGGRDYEITGIDPIFRVSPVCVLSIHSIN